MLKFDDFDEFIHTSINFHTLKTTKILQKSLFKISTESASKMA